MKQILIILAFLTAFVFLGTCSDDNPPPDWHAKPLTQQDREFLNHWRQETGRQPLPDSIP